MHRQVSIVTGEHLIISVIHYHKLLQLVSVIMSCQRQTYTQKSNSLHPLPSTQLYAPLRALIETAFLHHAPEHGYDRPRALLHATHISWAQSFSTAIIGKQVKRQLTQPVIHALSASCQVHYNHAAHLIFNSIAFYDRPGKASHHTTHTYHIIVYDDSSSAHGNQSPWEDHMHTSMRIIHHIQHGLSWMMYGCELLRDG